jgi:hypothetical protein
MVTKYFLDKKHKGASWKPPHMWPREIINKEKIKWLATKPYLHKLEFYDLTNALKKKYKKGKF